MHHCSFIKNKLYLFHNPIIFWGNYRPRQRGFRVDAFSSFIALTFIIFPCFFFTFSEKEIIKTPFSFDFFFLWGLCWLTEVGKGPQQAVSLATWWWGAAPSKHFIKFTLINACHLLRSSVMIQVGIFLTQPHLWTRLNWLLDSGAFTDSQHLLPSIMPFSFYSGSLDDKPRLHASFLNA